MRIGMYSPYVPKHIGGGEKYFFDVTRVLARRHTVEVGVSSLELDEQQVLRRYQRFLNTSLEGVSIVRTPLGTPASFFEKLRWTKQFDVLYYLTDGSIFFSAAKKNILHIQFPLKIDKSSLIEQLKLKNWHVKNTNSEFTKGVVEQNWPVTIDVVHEPMVAVPDSLPSTRKQKVILNVGRFFRHLHAKRQDVLIDIFRSMLKKKPKLLKEWQLVLIGSVEDAEYAKQLTQTCKGLPIKLLHEVTREELDAWYDKASIYWHATGFDVDEQAHPEKVEHFGISTVEAMSRGCVPVVLGKGGQKEILGKEMGDLLWQTKDDCIGITLEMIESSAKRKKYGKQAYKRSKMYGGQMFEKKLLTMIES